MTKQTLEKLLAETQKELEDVKQREMSASSNMYEVAHREHAEGYQEAIREVMQLIRDIFVDKERML